MPCEVRRGGSSRVDWSRHLLVFSLFIQFRDLVVRKFVFSQKAPRSSLSCPGRTRSSSPEKRSDFEVKSNYNFGIIEK